MGVKGAVRSKLLQRRDASSTRPSLGAGVVLISPGRRSSDGSAHDRAVHVRRAGRGVVRPPPRGHVVACVAFEDVLFRFNNFSSFVFHAQAVSGLGRGVCIISVFAPSLCRAGAVASLLVPPHILCLQYSKEACVCCF